MSKEITTYKLIKDYLDGKLTQSSLTAFEKRISKESDFKNYVENHKLANELIKRKELNNIKKELSKIHVENQKSFWKWKGWMVVCIGLISTVAIWWISDEKRQKEMKINRGEISIIDQELGNSSSNVLNEVSDLPKSINSSTSDVQLMDRATKSNIKREKNLQNVTAEKFQDSINQMEIKRFVVDETGGSKKPIFIDKRKEIENVPIESNSEPVDFLCPAFSITLELDLVPTCSGKANGRVKILNEELGQDFSYSLGNSDPQSSKEFSGLLGGEHTLKVIDKQGCKSDPIYVLIEELNCAVIIQPSKQIYWEIPQIVTQDKIVILEIYSARGGQLVYKNELLPNQLNIWKGETVNGQSLPIGGYTYVYRFPDYSINGILSILQ